MGAVACLVSFALFVWWFSTGVILLLNHLPEASFRWSMAAGSVLLVAVLGVVALVARSVSVGAAYAGFICGVLAWGWHEMSFFMGVLTGPRRSAAPASAGWARFAAAAGTLLYHQIAIAITAVLLLLLTADTPNRLAAWTFVTLWIMRLSANLNVFLGVRNLNEQFLPARLRYLRSYMRRRPMNALLPFSLLGGTAAALWLVHLAQNAATPFQRAADGLIATLLVLAVVEHGFMVIPLPFATLWNWYVRPARPGMATAAILPASAIQRR